MNTEKFYTLDKDTEDKFFSIFEKKSFPLSLKFKFIGSENQKHLVKISKLADQYAFLLDKEILVSFNEDLLNVFDDESIDILIEQEIDKLSVNIETGKIKMIKPDLETSSGLISKYGIDKIIKANQITELHHEQKKDKKAEFIA